MVAEEGATLFPVSYLGLGTIRSGTFHRPGGNPARDELSTDGPIRPLPAARVEIPHCLIGGIPQFAVVEDDLVVTPLVERLICLQIETVSMGVHDVWRQVAYAQGGWCEMKPSSE